MSNLSNTLVQGLRPFINESKKLFPYYRKEQHRREKLIEKLQGKSILNIEPCELSVINLSDKENCPDYITAGYLHNCVFTTAKITHPDGQEKMVGFHCDADTKKYDISAPEYRYCRDNSHAELSQLKLKKFEQIIEQEKDCGAEINIRNYFRLLGEGASSGREYQDTAFRMLDRSDTLVKYNQTDYTLDEPTVFVDVVAQKVINCSWEDCQMVSSKVNLIPSDHCEHDVNNKDTTSSKDATNVNEDTIVGKYTKRILQNKRCSHNINLAII